MRGGVLRRIAQHVFRHGARLFDQRGVFEVGVAQERQAALPGPDEFAGAAQAQVLARDLETVGALEDHFQARARQLAQRLGIEQDAGRLRRAAADATAQLVQLRKAEALGVFDHHQAGIGHIDADFDHGGRHQYMDFVVDESGHHRSLFAGLEAAMHQADALPRQVGS